MICVSESGMLYVPSKVEKWAIQRRGETMEWRKVPLQLLSVTFAGFLSGGFFFRPQMRLRRKLEWDHKTSNCDRRCSFALQTA